MNPVLVVALACALVLAVPMFAMADPASCDGRVVDAHYHGGTDVDQCLNTTAVERLIDDP